MLLKYEEQLNQIETAGDCSTALKDAQRIIVVGSGPVGMHFVSTVLEKRPDAAITVFGNEPFSPYNRVQLSSLLAGEVTPDEIAIPVPDLNRHPNFSYRVANVQRISRSTRTIIDNLEQHHRYDTLILATGARAHIPDIPGIDQHGVYRFRDLMDAESLAARLVRSRHVVIMGGGLLGLETAKAMHRSGTQVTLIQQGAHLMNRQLDSAAAEILADDITAMGIVLRVNAGVREVMGEGRVTGVRTYAGEIIECDTVIVCAGIRPNNELAREARLTVGKGIAVNDELRTNDPDIFAIGECCEYAGQTYGLVGPGLEQASVAASVVVGESACYKGSLAISRLKVIGKSVCSMGEVVELASRPGLKEVIYHDDKSRGYRKLVTLKGRLIGAVGVGDWPEVSRVQALYQECAYVWPWQRYHFKVTGSLWFEGDPGAVANWPGDVLICQCKSIPKKELEDHLGKGADSVAALQQCTGAGTVCGSCKPLLAELASVAIEPEKEGAWSTLLISSLVAVLLFGLIALTPSAELSDSVRTQGWFESIWTDKFLKQVTGFTLLGLTLFGLLMSLRKRMGFEWMGRFAYWRAAHAVLGALVLSVLVFHTGFHLGENLNRILILNFLAIVLLGSMAGSIVALGHKLSPDRARRLRQTWIWLHILVSWPIPALLIAHIVTVYYF